MLERLSSPGAQKWTSVRIDPQEYRRLELRAHALLADVPLHDVWAIDLPGGGEGRCVDDLRGLLSSGRLRSGNPAVRALFWLRARLGDLFGWDREPRQPPASRIVERLEPAIREASSVEPGTPQGAFRVVYVLPREALSEIRNATVHAFSLFALIEQPGGHRFYWAIYVEPVGRITRWYMRLIDPFRRLVVYPAMLRQIRAAWSSLPTRPSASG